MQKKIPQRQCMGCRERKAKRELIRVVRSPEGEVSLDFGGKKNGRGAQLSVSNDYRDGAHTDYSRFFERFYRGDTSHSSSKEGYGIGLSMAEDLTKLMKGKISVRWDKGVITFQVELG